MTSCDTSLTQNQPNVSKTLSHYPYMSNIVALMASGLENDRRAFRLPPPCKRRWKIACSVKFGYLWPPKQSKKNLLDRLTSLQHQQLFASRTIFRAKKPEKISSISSIFTLSSLVNSVFARPMQANSSRGLPITCCLLCAELLCLSRSDNLFNFLSV